MTPLPVDVGKVLGLGQFEASVLGAAHDGRGQGVFAAPLQAGRQAEQGGFVRSRHRRHGNEFGFAFREGAGFIHHQGVYLAQHFDGFGVLEQHPHRGPFAGGHHDGHGGGKAQGAGAGDDQHRHGVDDGVGHAGLGPEEGPDHEGDHGHRHHRGHEVAGHHVHQPLDGGPAALGFGDHLDDLGQEGPGAHPFGPHHQGAGAVDGGADDPVAGALFHRDGLAGDHGFVHRAFAFQD